MEARLKILVESRIRGNVYVRFGGEYSETYRSNTIRRWVLSLQNKVLFPIVTLIIMDVFLQKMRHRKDRRKALIVEEAWKAIASPLMASYLLYL